MLEELFNSGTLNLVYAAIAVLSFLYAVIALVGAEVGDALDFDIDTEGDTGIDFIDVSPFALAMFGSTFGLVGLLTRLWLDMETTPSILWAVGSGVVVGAVAQTFFIYVLSPSKSSHYSLQQDAIGREAEVITTIPSKGLGEVAFNNVSGRVKLGARSATGEEIGYGNVVIIKRIVGRVAFVQPSHEP